jgi:hypothetical protein
VDQKMILDDLAVLAADVVVLDDLAVAAVPAVLVPASRPISAANQHACNAVLALRAKTALHACLCAGISS